MEEQNGATAQNLTEDEWFSKSDIVTKVAEVTGEKKKTVKKIVDGTFDAIANVMTQGGAVTIQNFGRFAPRVAAPRTYTIAHTNRTGTVGARYLPGMKFSKNLIEDIKSGLQA